MKRERGRMRAGGFHSHLHVRGGLARDARRMYERLRQTGRLIYLLALFQLAGGPLVIGGVLLTGKLWRLGPAAEAGAMTAGAAACHPDEPAMLEAGALERLLLEMKARTPDDPQKPAPVPAAKEMNGKLWTIQDLGGPLRLAAAPPLIARLPAESVWLVARSHPPPAPPPRAA